MGKWRILVMFPYVKKPCMFSSSLGDRDNLILFLIGEGKGYRKWGVGWDLGPQPVAISAQLPSYKFSPSSDHSLLLSVFNMAVICFHSYNFFFR